MVWKLVRTPSSRIVLFDVAVHVHILDYLLWSVSLVRPTTAGAVTRAGLGSVAPITEAHPSGAGGIAGAGRAKGRLADV